MLFLEQKLQIEDYWRGIILFGLNSASYKFALAKTLLDLKSASGQLLKLEELAIPFSHHVAAHLKIADKQTTSKSSTFLETCREFNAGKITKDQLIDQTVRLAFNNVIDAFHSVGRNDIGPKFFIDERKENRGIRLTDEFSKLLESSQTASLLSEVESRWRLVETAWELGVNRELLSIKCDVLTKEKELFVVDHAKKRKPITSCRNALNGYQMGKCFHCFCEIHIDGPKVTAQVDHFFPHTFKKYPEFRPYVDGIWNLVLACEACNGAKSNRIPVLKLLERLFKRNEFLIDSHHPLGETIQKHMGHSKTIRSEFLKRWYSVLPASWEPEERGPKSF